MSIIEGRWSWTTILGGITFLVLVILFVSNIPMWISGRDSSNPELLDRIFKWHESEVYNGSIACICDSWTCAYVCNEYREQVEHFEESCNRICPLRD